MRIRAVESLGVLQPGAATVLPQALADRNSGPWATEVMGAFVQGLRVRGARSRTILTIGTVPVLPHCSLVRTGTLGPPL